MNNLSNKILIFYFFQLESSKELNVTSIPTTNQPITIKDAIMALPIDLSHGQYHFRFKSQFVQGDQKVLSWIDINNLGAKVPQVNGSIYIKILKTKDQNQSKLFPIEKLKKAEIIKSHSYSNNHAHQHVHSAPKVVHGDSSTHNNHVKDPSSNLNNNLGRGPHNKNPQTPQSVPNAHQKSPTTYKQPPKAPIQQVQQPQKPNLVQSFISFEIPIAQPQAKTASVTATTEQKLEIFRNQFDTQEQNKQNERLASLEFQETLRKWGYTDGKKINNTTTLLATLHQVWPEWQPVSLTDMLKPELVSAFFKKAVIKVHPDKNRNRNFKEKYLSKRIFELLNQSRKQ